MKRTITSLELTNELKEQLIAEAAEREMSLSALIRWILKQYYKQKGRELTDGQKNR